jgi:hypothetical protein
MDCADLHQRREDTVILREQEGAPLQRSVSLLQAISPQHGRLCMNLSDTKRVGDGQAHHGAGYRRGVEQRTGAPHNLYTT